MDLIAEFHDRYIKIDLGGKLDLPTSLKELLRFILSRQGGYKQLCPGCGFDMGVDWPSQFCSRMCFSGGWW